MNMRFAKMSVQNESLAESFTVSVAGDREVSVSGCKKVLTYEEDLIRIQTRECVVAVKGEALSLKSFHPGEMRITGRIDTLAIERG